MLKPKVPKRQTSEPIPYNGDDNLQEEVEQNPLIEMYHAVKRAIETIRENPNDENSPCYFKTIAIDNGQFLRIIRDENLEAEIAFPAIFIHYTNVRYLVLQQRIGQGRAIMRVRFILNNLDPSDPHYEVEPFRVFQQVNLAIQDAKNHEPSLQERCNLTFFDMPTTVNHLQAYWIDYEVWYRETSTWIYKDWEKRYIVMPPFTNHSDAPDQDEHSHGDHNGPTYDDSTKFTPSVEVDDEEKDVNEPKEGDI